MARFGGWVRGAVAVLALTVAAVPRLARADGDLGTLQLGAGAWNLTGHDTSSEFEASYQPALNLAHILYPEVGVLGSGDGDIYFYGGVIANLEPAPHVVVSPSLAAGAWSGSGLDLGPALEYRAGVDVGWRYDNGTKLGVDLARIGNGDSSSRDPGATNLTLTFAVPIGSAF